MLGLTKALDKQVLFYNLQDDNQVDKSICRITNFYYKKKLKILIIGEDKSQIDTLNDLLWTFEQISFLPHSFESEYESTPIVLCMIDNLQPILDKYKSFFLDMFCQFFLQVSKSSTNANDSKVK